MTVWRHVAMWLVTYLTWVGLYVVGMPSDNFAAWNLDQLILLNLVTAFAVMPLIGGLTLALLGGDYARKSLWFAFYASFPLLVYDFIVEGLIGGAGLRFLISQWYITIRYLYVWIELPLIGLALDAYEQGVLRATHDQGPCA